MRRGGRYNLQPLAVNILVLVCGWGADTREVGQTTQTLRDTGLNIDGLHDLQVEFLWA
jgi:hypothetical protein